MAPSLLSSIHASYYKDTDTTLSLKRTQAGYWRSAGQRTFSLRASFQLSLWNPDGSYRRNCYRAREASLCGGCRLRL